MYPLLWTSLLVAMHDDIENTSIVDTLDVIFEKILLWKV